MRRGKGNFDRVRVHGLALKRTGITGIGIALNAQPRKYGRRHFFQTQNRELDEPRDVRDDTETKARELVCASAHS